MCVFVPGAKLQLPLIWHSCLAGQWQFAKIARSCWLSVCTHIHSLVYCIVSFGWLLILEAAAATDDHIECEAVCMARWEEGCMWQGRWGFWGLLGGRLPTLCAPNPGESAGHCGSLLVRQPESWERGFQLRRADDKQVFSKSSSLGFSLALLSSLSFLAVSLLCSGCSAQSAPASYSMVICEWSRLVIQSWGMI